MDQLISGKKSLDAKGKETTFEKDKLNLSVETALKSATIPNPQEPAEVLEF